MPRPDAGATDCSSGLAKLVYDQWLGDTTRNGLQGNAVPADWHDMVKSIAYAYAKGVADALQHQARATINITAGGPGSAAVSSGSNISGASIQANATLGVRVARLTFATAMPDTDYVPVVTRQYPIGSVVRQLFIVTKTTTYFEVASMGTDAGAWTNVDEVTQQFGVIVDR
jgi:hypothetical protein